MPDFQSHKLGAVATLLVLVCALSCNTEPVDAAFSAQCAEFSKLRSQPMPCSSKAACDFLEKNPDEVLSFTLVQKKSTGPGYSDSYLRQGHACISDHIEKLGGRLLSPFGGPGSGSDINVTATYKQMRPAYRLLAIDSIYEGCGKDNCAFCARLLPGPACQVVPFCSNFSSRKVFLDEARNCVRTGSQEPVVCQGAAICGDLVTTYRDQAGQCWESSSDCSVSAKSIGFVPEQCVPPTIPPCK